MVDGSTRTESLRAWISSHVAWVVWGAVVGFWLWGMTAYQRFGPHDGPLAGFDAWLFGLLAVAAAAAALLIRFVTLSETRLKKEWPVLVVFPSIATATFLAAWGMTLVVAHLMKWSAT